MGYTQRKFGSIYMGGETLPIPTNPTDSGDITNYSPVKPLVIGDTVPGYAINWIQPDGQAIFIADRVLVNRINFWTLDTFGFVGGKNVLIDGQKYFCRLIDANPKVSNEWVRAIKQISDAEKVLHTKGMYSWSRNKTRIGTEEQIVAYGYQEPSLHSAFPHNYQQPFVGFRPVLIPDKGKKKELSSSKPIVLDGQEFCVQFQVFDGNDAFKSDFVPVLMPVMDGDTERFDRALFGTIPNGTEIQMYTLLMDNQPVKIGEVGPTYKQGATLVFTDQYFGDEYLIPWTIVGGKAVSSRVLLRDVSKSDLTAQPFFEDDQVQLWI